MDTSELRIIISAQMEQAKQALESIGHAADAMAAEMEGAGSLSSEAIDGIKRSIDELKANMDTIHNKNVKVIADTAKAEADLEAFKEFLKTIPNDKNIKINFEKRTVTMNEVTPGVSGGGGALLGVGLGLLPGLIPIAASATTAVMGLAGAFAAATAGIGGFAAVAIPDLKSVFTAASAANTAQQQLAEATTKAQRTTALQNLQKAYYGLDAAQVQAVHSLQSFENFFHSFSQSFQTPVLTDFTKALSMVETLMNDMRPVIQEAAGAIGQLMDAMNKGLQSNQMKTFFQWLAIEAGPAITSFGQVAGNVFKGISSLLMAFTPSISSFENGLVSLTGKFAAWAQSLTSTKGFKEFLQYAAQAGPMVMSLLGNLVQIVVTLLKDLAPVGAVMLKFVGDIANLVKQLLQSNPLIKNLVTILLDGAKNILIAADAVIRFVTWLGKAHPVVMDVITAIGLATGAFFAFNAVVDANPISLIIIAIAALIAGIVELITHWKQVRSVMESVWNSVVSVTHSIWNGLITFLQGVWSKIHAFFAKWGTDILAVLAPFIGVPLLVAQHWSQITSLLQGIWNGLVSWIKGAAQNFANIVVNAFSWLYNHNYYFKDLVDFIHTQWTSFVSFNTAIWNGIKSTLTTIWSGIKSVAMSAWNAIKTTLVAIWHALVSSSEAVWKPIQSFFSKLWHGVRSTSTSAWNGIRAALSSVWHATVSEAETIWRGLGSFFSNLAHEAFSWGSNLVRMIANGIRSAISDVTSAASSVAHALAKMLGFHSPTEEGPASDSDTWAPNFMKMFAGGVTSNLSLVASAAGQVAGTLAGTLSPSSGGTLSYIQGNGAGGIPTVGTTVNVPVQVNINAPVYGVNDLEQVIKNGVNKHVVPLLIQQLRQPARAMGVT